MSEYVKQAEKFAQKNGVKLTFIGQPEYKKHFADDKQHRFVFKCRLSRGGKSYTFDFGQSINNGSEDPNIYDVLTCLQKYDIGTFENFCSEFGYDQDSRTAERIYKAVLKEFAGVERLFSDIIEELQEIQ